MNERIVWVLAQPTFAHHERGEYVVKRGRAMPLRDLGAPFEQTYVVVDDSTNQILGEYLMGGLFASEAATLVRLASVRDFAEKGATDGSTD